MHGRLGEQRRPDRPVRRAGLQRIQAERAQDVPRRHFAVVLVARVALTDLAARVKPLQDLPERPAPGPLAVDSSRASNVCQRCRNAAPPRKHGGLVGGCLPGGMPYRAGMARRGAASAAAQGTGLVLLTLASGQFVMTLDSSVMNVSIATVAKDVGTTVTGIQ